ncbi:winged helix-turn-helix transcriptional regulator [Natrinema salsiterrestre]|uniref:Helix-turn-helix transcriptional regulator n=1 Tax=Natrinema salsiterrestre TaxID=2950540 RepID=A0A9Q4Q1X9_9EURY|nr:helix-turn-helix domain-containing protein [Natrinema salsiterrestre]MDF9748560.1 helix-turn-helix transcriptional regulator [Natrinema salsiterrestre]
MDDDASDGTRSNATACRNRETASSEAEQTAGIDAGRTPGEARSLRDRLELEERERVERTVAQLLNLFGKAHAMAILSAFAFADEPLRFSELEERLEVPANTLSERLKELVAVGFLRRESYDEVPPRVEYEPTEKCRGVFPAFGHLHAWAIEYDLEPVEE